MGRASPGVAGGRDHGGLLPLSPLHHQVASIALGAAAGHGFALGGGNALLAHGVITRPTQDVDLFTDREHGVEAAAGAVEAALRGAGFTAERQDQDGGLADIFPDMGEGLAEWIVTAPDGQELTLQLAYFDRAREPVDMDVGPSWTSRTWPAARPARWRAPRRHHHARAIRRLAAHRRGRSHRAAGRTPTGPGTGATQR